MKSILEKVRAAAMQREASLLAASVAAKEIEQCDKKLAVMEEGRTLAQATAAAMHARSFSGIEAMVSGCLSAVFGTDIAFQIKLSMKANKSHAEFLFVENGEELDPMDDAAGGYVDVAALALRVCALLLTPNAAKLLVLDEPFRFVGVDVRENVRLLIQSLSETHGIQFIMVTHYEELECGKIVRIK